MRKFLILCFLFVSFGVEAKRDFAVFSELRCDNFKCFDKESGMPFNGALRSFYDNGVVKINIEYKDGLRDGASHYYYNSGNEKRQEVYKKGVIYGMLTEYYDGGNLKYEVEFDNGKRNGAFRSYYEDGTLKVDEEYIDGKLEGRSRKFNTRGKLIREAFYNNGVLLSGNCASADGGKKAFTQKMIDAYNQEGIVPCNFERAVTF